MAPANKLPLREKELFLSEQICQARADNRSAHETTLFPLPLFLGIHVTQRSSVSGCTASDNMGVGIEFSTQCLITTNVAGNNGNGAVGDGFRSTGVNNRIDTNVAESNKAAGIRSNDPSDIIVRNSAHNNPGGNYIFVGGIQNIGPTGIHLRQALGGFLKKWRNFSSCELVTAN